MPRVLRITGDREMARRLREIANRVPGVMGNALRQTAEEIKTEAQVKHVPVDLGDLRGSAHVGSVVHEGRDLSVTIAFGGTAAPYALAIHEHPSKHSPRSWRGKSIGDIRSVRSRTPWNVGAGRGPKYLDRPMKRSVRDGSFVRRIVDLVKGAVRG